MATEKVTPSGPPCMVSGRCPGKLLRNDKSVVIEAPTETAQRAAIWNSRMQGLCTTDYPLLAEYVPEEDLATTCVVQFSRQLAAGTDESNVAVVDAMFEMAAQRANEAATDKRVKIGNYAIGGKL